MDSRLGTLRRTVLIGVSLTALLAFGAAGPAAAAETTKPIAFKAHLHAETDPTSFSPGCTFGSTLPDCNHVHYSGEGTYTGGLVGSLRFSGDSFLRMDGKVGTDETDTFVGKLVGCGQGTFSYKAAAIFQGFDAAKGGIVGDETLTVIAGSGTAALKGLSGGARGSFVVNPDGSIDADYDWGVTCVTNTGTRRGPGTTSPGAKSPRKRCRGRRGRPGRRGGRGGGGGGCRRGAISSKKGR